MLRGGADTGGVRLPPLHDFFRGARLRTAKGWLSSMRLAGGDERCTSGGAATVTSFFDPQSLHIGDLREDGEYEFPCSTPDLAKPAHFHDDVLVEQPAYGGLDVERIAAQPVNGVHADDIAAADVPEQFGESGSICCEHCARDTLVLEFTLEVPAEGGALGFDRLISGR